MNDQLWHRPDRPLIRREKGYATACPKVLTARSLEEKKIKKNKKNKKFGG